jgi:16S rRNA (cytosine967-C5)-methyltransferase
MKLHRPLILAASETLKEIFESGVYAEQAVEKLLKGNARWGSRDRKFLAATVYSVVRNKLLYESILASMDPGKELNYFKLIGVYLLLHENELPDWPEWTILKMDEVFARQEELYKVRKIKYSVPDWLDNKGVKEYGEVQWEKELSALNSEAKVVIRINSGKCNKKTLIAAFNKDGIATKELSPDFCSFHGAQLLALQLEERKNIKNNPAFLSGWFELQDAGSQLIAPYLEANAGETVIDACAGGGGKTLHLANLMQNKGKIIALDVHEYKLKNLEKRLQRAGVRIVQAKKIQDELIQSLAGTADRLLLDVPCSGSGVLRRQVDTKWKLKQEDIDGLVLLQRKVLCEYSPMLKPGGKMVYATCSIFSEENEEQVQWFLKDMKGAFQLIKQKRVTPSEGYDGFYMALMERK